MYTVSSVDDSSYRGCVTRFVLYYGGNGLSLFSAALLLGIMILPTIISISESAIRAVPDKYYQGALALGATHERSVFRTVVPAAKSGIMAGIVLGIGRAFGETMAVIMIARQSGMDTRQHVLLILEL